MALSLSVIMPAYNEEQNIEATLRRAIPSLRRVVERFELLLINDCSTDRTGEIAERLSQEFPELKVIHNTTNLRQGGSLRRGFSLAQMELMTHNALDYPFDFDDLPVLLGHFPAADVVVASREEYPGVTQLRLWMSLANRLLIRGLFGLGLKDYNFIQVYKRDAVSLSQCFSSATTFITPELIIRAHYSGRKVIEVMTQYHPRVLGKPSSANWRNIKQALLDMARLYFELKFGYKRG